MTAMISKYVNLIFYSIKIKLKPHELLIIWQPLQPETLYRFLG